MLLFNLNLCWIQVKKNILQPHNSNYGSGSSAVPYFVLDIKNGHSIDSSGKSKRYIYNFVQQKMQPETADQLDAQFDSIDFSLKVGDLVVSLVHLLDGTYNHYELCALSCLFKCSYLQLFLLYKTVCSVHDVLTITFKCRAFLLF